MILAFIFGIVIGVCISAYVILQSMSDANLLSTDENLQKQRSN